jgi:hypothetical protein
MARATAGALTPDGRLVAAGVACVGGRGAQCVGGSPRLALARYLGGGDPTREPRPTPGPGPAPAPPGVQTAPFAALTFPDARGIRAFRVRIRVACLRDRPCRGTLRVRTQRAYRPARRPNGRRRAPRVVTLARTSVRVPSGRSRDVTLRLLRTGRTLVRDRRRVPVRVSLRAGGKGGAEVGRLATLAAR